MLIHKATCGVLGRVYINGNFERERDAKFTLFPDLNQDEWWEVKWNSSLGLKAARYYPDFIPHTDDDGNLIDIEPLRILKQSIESRNRKSARKKLLDKRGYDEKVSNKVLNRPTGMFDFLDFGVDLNTFAKA